MPPTSVVFGGIYGGLAGAVFNAAKEQALDDFIAGRIRFTDMSAVTETALERMSAERDLIDAAMTLDNVTRVDHLARQQAARAAEERIG